MGLLADPALARVRGHRVPDLILDLVRDLARARLLDPVPDPGPDPGSGPDLGFGPGRPWPRLPWSQSWFCVRAGFAPHPVTRAGRRCGQAQAMVPY